MIRAAMPRVAANACAPRGLVIAAAGHAVRRRARQRRQAPTSRAPTASATGSSRSSATAATTPSTTTSADYASSAPEQTRGGQVTMSARATQSLSRFNLDFSGDSVGVGARRRAAARTSSSPGEELVITPAPCAARGRAVHGRRALRLRALHAGRRTEHLPVRLVHHRRRLGHGRPARPRAHDLPDQRPPGRQGELHDPARRPAGVDGGRQRRAAVQLHRAAAGRPGSTSSASRWPPS